MPFPFLVCLLAAALPAAPVDGIRDDAHVIAASDHAQLANELAAFTRSTGIAFFVDTNTFRNEQINLGERTRGLLREWSQGQPAVLLSIERSTGAAPVVQLSHALWERFSEPELIALLQDTATQLTDSRDLSQSVPAAMHTLMQRLGQLHHATNASTLPAQSAEQRLRLAFLTIILVGILLSFLRRCFSRSADARAARRLVFPSAHLLPRFAAPDGGGVMGKV